MNRLACVHLVDDDAHVLQALVHMLAAAGIMAMTYASAEELLADTAGLPPGCVLTDVRMPGMGGLELVRRLKAEAPGHPVIVMSGHADMALVIEAMRAGASDFLGKPFGSAALVETVRRSLEAGARNAALGADVANYRKVFATLSRRQRDVLDGILAGKLNKTIAHDLGISVRTVEEHRAALMTKTRAPASAALVRMAMLAGL